MKAMKDSFAIGCMLGLITSVGYAGAVQDAGVVPANAAGAWMNVAEFVENKGQWDPEARFLSRNSGLDLWVTDTGLVYDFYRLAEVPWSGADLLLPERYRDTERNVIRYGHPIRMEFIDSAGIATSYGDALQGTFSYFKGRAKEKWATGVLRYPGSKIEHIYPGIDAVLRSEQGAPRYDLIVQPGADPGAIVMRYQGAYGVHVNLLGDLVISTIFGNAVHTGLEAYQFVGGEKQRVQCRFIAGLNGTVRFALGKYDLSRPLIIDPLVVAPTALGGPLIMSTFVGGGSSEYGRDIVIDDASEVPGVIITGFTFSGAFPSTVDPYGDLGLVDVFVTKLDPTLTALIYSAVIGGTSNDYGYGVDVNSEGFAYFTGYTDTRAGLSFPADTTIGDGGGFDIFVGALNEDATVLSESYAIGGASFDLGADIAFYINPSTSDDAFHVTGWTASEDFPVTEGAYDTFFEGVFDAYVVSIDVGDPDEGYITFLGGRLADYGRAVTLAGTSALVTGSTESFDFPTNDGAFDRTFNGASDAFVTLMGTSGANVSWSTYIGGAGGDDGRDIVVNGSGEPILTGNTSSFDWPTTTGAYDTSYNGAMDVFVAHLESDGSALIFSTFLGSELSDTGSGVGVDGSGNIYLTGYTVSSQFPVTDNAHDDTFNGGQDAFISKINPAGDALDYSTFVGGADNDWGERLAVSSTADRVLVIGTTRSPAFPTITGAFDETYNGLDDVFLLEMDTPSAGVSLADFDIVPDEVTGDGTATGTVSLTGPAPGGGALVTLLSSNPGVASVPADVTVPAGETEASFTVTISNPPNTTDVTITATYLGVDRTATIRVNAIYLLGIQLFQAALTGGQSTIATVTLNHPAPAGGIVVDLSSASAVLMVPPNVTIPQGSTFATFTVDTLPVIMSITVRLDATYNGVRRSVFVEVIASVVLSVLTDPRHVTGGDPSTGTVRLTGEAPAGGILVTLSSSHPSVAKVPLSITIPQGSDSGTFLIMTQPVLEKTLVVISASHVTTKTALLIVSPPGGQ